MAPPLKKVNRSHREEVRDKVLAVYRPEYEIALIQDDFCEAEPGNPRHCAIAIGLKRVEPRVTYGRVGHGTMAWTDKQLGVRITARTSMAAMEAQKRFDSGEPMGPDDFPVIRFRMDEALIEPIEFNERVRANQNERRKKIREGKVKVKHLTPAQKERYKRIRRAS